MFSPGREDLSQNQSAAELLEAQLEESANVASEAEDPDVWARFVGKRFQNFPIDWSIGDPTKVTEEFVLIEEENYGTFTINGAKYMLRGASLQNADDASLRVIVDGDELRWSHGYRSVVVVDPDEDPIDGSNEKDIGGGVGDFHESALHHASGYDPIGNLDHFDRVHANYNIQSNTVSPYDQSQYIQSMFNPVTLDQEHPEMITV